MNKNLEKIHTHPLLSVSQLQSAHLAALNLELSAKAEPSSKVWNDQLYVDRLAPSPNITRSFTEQKLELAQLANMLTSDFEHLVKEMSLAETETVYYLDINQDEFLGDGYGDESLELMLSNFVHLLHEKGPNTTRALIEHLVFSRTKQFFIDLLKQSSDNPATPNPVIIITSPPDTISNGYHGIDSLHNFSLPETHHTFFYVMELEKQSSSTSPHLNQKSNTAHIKVTQYRTWHNIAGLLELHQRLGGPIKLDNSTPVTTQIFANTLVINHQLSSEELHDLLKKQLYFESETWPRRPEQAPLLPNLEKFNQEWKQFFQNFYLPKALALYEQLTTNPHQDETFKNQIMQQLEILFSFFIRAIEKRVQELNINPQYTQLLEEELLREILTHPENSELLGIQLQTLHQLKNKQLSSEKKIPPTPTLKTRAKKITKAYDLQVKKEVFQQSLSAKETSWYNQNLTGVISITSFVMGSAQCYAIAPFSTITQLGKAFGSVEFSHSFNLVLEQTSLYKRKQLLQDILKENYQELRLSGANRTYMIPASYFEEPGCKVQTNGDVIGPCGIPLDQDPMVFPMDRFAFNQFIQELQRSISIDETHQEIFGQEQNEEIKTEAHQLLEILYRKIFKQSVGLNALLASNPYQLSQTALELPFDVFLLLKEAINPLQMLKEIIDKMTNDVTRQDKFDSKNLLSKEIIVFQGNKPTNVLPAA